MYGAKSYYVRVCRWLYGELESGSRGCDNYSRSPLPKRVTFQGLGEAVGTLTAGNYKAGAHY